MALSGQEWVEGEYYHYTDADGVERYCVNVVVDNADIAEVVAWLN